MTVVELKQGSLEWLHWRDGGIGASDVPALLGVGVNGTTREMVIREKVKRKKRDTNFAMRKGVSLEPRIRRDYEDLYQVRAVPLCVEYGPWPTLRASLDGWIEDRKLLIEIKYSSWDKHEFALNEIVPECYMPQVQAQMLCVGAEVAHYVSYSDAWKRFRVVNRMTTVTVERDQAMQSRILAEARLAWSEILKLREEADGHS